LIHSGTVAEISISLLTIGFTILHTPIMIGIALTFRLILIFMVEEGLTIGDGDSPLVPSIFSLVTTIVHSIIGILIEILILIGLINGDGERDRIGEIT